MPEKKTKSDNRRTREQDDLLKIIKGEHEEVKQMFRDFEKTPEEPIARRILTALGEHVRKEEEIVYPPLLEIDEEFFHEADQEHHVVHLLLAELEKFSDDPSYEAKMNVLRENVEHHIKEEETTGFRLIREIPAEERSQLAVQWQGEKMAAGKRRAA